MYTVEEIRSKIAAHNCVALSIDPHIIPSLSSLGLVNSPDFKKVNLCQLQNELNSNGYGGNILSYKQFYDILKDIDFYVGTPKEYCGPIDFEVIDFIIASYNFIMDADEQFKVITANVATDLTVPTPMPYDLGRMLCKCDEETMMCYSLFTGTSYKLTHIVDSSSVFVACPCEYLYHDQCSVSPPPPAGALLFMTLLDGVVVLGVIG